LASVLAMRPDVLILDEPTAGLDPQGRRQLLGRILSWQAETGLTLVVISHDQEELARMAERVVILVDGRIAADGSARQLLSDRALLQGAGLDVPCGVALLETLCQASWTVCTDRLLPQEAADEIAAAWERRRKPL